MASWVAPLYQRSQKIEANNPNLKLERLEKEASQQ